MLQQRCFVKSDPTDFLQVMHWIRISTHEDLTYTQIDIVANGRKKSSAMEGQLPKTINFIKNRETKYFLKLVMTRGREHRTRTKKQEATDKTKK